MTLKEKLKKELNLDESWFSSWCSDLYILYRDDILKYVLNTVEFPKNISISLSNVKGQDWYGKRFIEIPFAYTEYYSKRKLCKT